MTAGEDGLIRVNEREDGFFRDVGALLSASCRSTRRAASGCSACCSARAPSGMPFADGRLCLGRWQRILLVGFREGFVPEWHVTVVG